jgi:hypothetical protein
MSELLVRVRDRAGHNPKLCGEGHVVVVCRHGWKWSRLEQTNPDWRIVRVPDMTEEEASTLLSSQKEHPEWFDCARRAFWLDPDALPADLRTWWLDDSRAEPIKIIPKQMIVAATTSEPLYKKPNVLGATPVLG